MPGWHIDPQDGQDKLLNRDGELVIRIDHAGTVWNFSGAASARSPCPGIAISRAGAGAHQMLLHLEQRQGQPPRPGGGRR